MCEKSVFRKGDLVYDICYGWGIINVVLTSGCSVMFSSVFYESKSKSKYIQFARLSFTDYSSAISHDRNDIEEVFEVGEAVWYRFCAPNEWFCGIYQRKFGDLHEVKANSTGILRNYQDIRKYENRPF